MGVSKAAKALVASALLAYSAQAPPPPSGPFKITANSISAFKFPRLAPQLDRSVPAIIGSFVDPSNANERTTLRLEIDPSSASASVTTVVPGLDSSRFRRFAPSPSSGLTNLDFPVLFFLGEGTLYASDGAGSATSATTAHCTCSIGGECQLTAFVGTSAWAVCVDGAPKLLAPRDVADFCHDDAPLVDSLTPISLTLPEGAVYFPGIVPPQGPGVKLNSPWVPCGSHMYFTLLVESERRLARVPLTGGDTTTVTLIDGYPLPLSIDDVALTCQHHSGALLVRAGADVSTSILAYATDSSTTLSPQAFDSDVDSVRPGGIIAAPYNDSPDGFCWFGYNTVLFFEHTLICQAVPSSTISSGDLVVEATFGGVRVPEGVSLSAGGVGHMVHVPSPGNGKLVFRCGAADATGTNDVCVLDLDVGRNLAVVASALTRHSLGPSASLTYAGFTPFYHANSDSWYVLFAADDGTSGGDGMALWGLRV